MELRTKIEQSLQKFTDSELQKASLNLLNTLGYQSEKTLDLGGAPETFLDQFVTSPGLSFNKDKALFDDWNEIHLLFQLTDEELSKESSLFETNSIDTTVWKSYLFFAIELKGEDYARGKLTAVVRQINRLFQTPVMVLIKHGDFLSVAVINRRQHKLQADKDVLGKVTIIRDISLTSPHRGHLDILDSFALPSLLTKTLIHDFDTLHAAWEEIFNVELLNKRFYKELANWYFWALPEIKFPDDLKPKGLSSDQETTYYEKLRSTGLIRLLTRLIFCWFLKEKDLIPKLLFDETKLPDILKNLDDNESTFHRAILQNLFFATLNQRMGGKYRVFTKDSAGIDNLYRYDELFKNPDAALTYFEGIPFLNGGLFECLDYTDDKGKKIYVDGFSRNKQKRPHIPNRFFFGEGEVNISAVTGEKKRGTESARGLIHILSDYKFTIVENTPIDQEIALDPELLGKVFENLLASYNEETKTTARKQTGSFYTPRPIVDYMADESLKAHFVTVLSHDHKMLEEDAQAGLDILFAYTEKQHIFDEDEILILIKAIDNCKILDPACGSGAFPMGVLHKLVYILTKLDPDNENWKQTQLSKLDSAPMREELERTFGNNNDDYGRKLYLIENCLYGVDIQPIAIQITKLRFFISLICDQKTNKNIAQNFGVKPLPNLETKFVAANTLIPLDKKIHAGLAEFTQTDLFGNPNISEIEKELQQVRHDYFAVQTRQKKHALQRKDKQLRYKLTEELISGSGVDQSASRSLAQWDPYNPHVAADFFEPLWMFDRSLINGFDIVIGNPPYRVVKDKAEKKVYDSIYFHQDYQKDLYLLFFERASHLLKPLGVLAFITPNTLLYSLTFKKIRTHLRNSYIWIRVLIPHTKVKVFTAVVDTIVSIFKFTSENSTDYNVNVDLLTDAGLDGFCLSTKYIPTDGATINVGVPTEFHRLYKKIREKSVDLSTVAGVFNGIKPFEKGKGTPPQDATVMREKPYVVSGSQPDGSDWRPLLRGSLIEQYKIRWDNNYWIKYGPWLAAPRDSSLFTAPEKICVRQTGDSIIATLVGTGFVMRNNLHIILASRDDMSLFAVLGILNSKLIHFVYCHMNPEQGEALAEVKKMHVEMLPIPKNIDTQSVNIENLVKKIISIKKETKEQDTEELMSQINQIIYKLYDLTKEEIMLVESRSA